MAAASCGSSESSQPARDAGAASDGTACTAATCASAGAQCGSISDGCGGILELRHLPVRHVVRRGGHAQPLRLRGGCTPKTCADARPQLRPWATAAAGPSSAGPVLPPDVRRRRHPQRLRHQLHPEDLRPARGQLRPRRRRLRRHPRAAAAAARDVRRRRVPSVCGTAGCSPKTLRPSRDRLRPRRRRLRRPAPVRRAVPAPTPAAAAASPSVCGAPCASRRPAPSSAKLRRGGRRLRRSPPVRHLHRAEVRRREPQRVQIPASCTGLCLKQVRPAQRPASPPR